MSLLRPALISGISLIFVAFFANYLGLDNDITWGPRRYLIFVIGIILLNLSAISKIFTNGLRNFIYPVLEQLNSKIKISDTKKIALLVISAIGVVFFVYLWYGFPKHETLDSVYYAKLATAFKQGHLYLDEKPSKALLELKNPFDYNQRVAFDADDSLFDVSFYDQKFYLYWGPVPGILIMPLGFETLTHFGDQWLVYTFLCGVMVYSSLIGLQLWQNTNKNIPLWLLPLTLLVIGLSPPLLWILNSPKIYQAAIMGSQFFFIGGCYWAYRALKRKQIRAVELTLSSIHWALALGTRITVLPSILLATVILLIHIYGQAKIYKSITIKYSVIYLGLPTLIAVILLGWYNWQRFDSVFESGTSYILTAGNTTETRSFFSTSHIKENLRNYFYYPVVNQARFPYIRPTENTFSNERMAGILYTSPFLFLYSFSIRWMFSKSNGIKEIAEKRIALILLGSSLISLSLILTFYFPTARYAAEFTPSLLLLALINLRQISRTSQRVPNDHFPFIILIGVISIIMGILITIPHEQSQQVIKLFGSILEN